MSEHTGALTNAQRMPVSIHPSAHSMSGEGAWVYAEQGCSLKLSVRQRSEPRGRARALVRPPFVKKQRKKMNHFSTCS